MDEAEEEITVEQELYQSEDATISKIHNSTRQYLLKLMIRSLNLAAPNLAHYLLGFELRKPVSKTVLQDQG